MVDIETIEWAIFVTGFVIGFAVGFFYQLSAIMDLEKRWRHGE